MDSMITTTTWVRRGVAAQFPIKYEIDEDEINRISAIARLQLEDAKGELEAAKNISRDEAMDEEADEKVTKLTGKNSTNGNHDDEDNDLKEYDLDHYDSDEVDEDGEEVTMFGNVKSLAYHKPGEKDPYLEFPQEEEDEDREELQILGTDNLLIAGKVEDEVAHLEVYVYEDSEENLYVHHDIMLPAIPLCVEWLDFPVGKDMEGRTNGNFVAVGTMEPDIEIWDLDIVDCMYPNAILGAGDNDNDKSSNKKKKKKSKKANDEYHVDSVLALAANRQHRNLLASASADVTVKLWDLSTQKCAKSYSYHKDKICALDWHPKESIILLSGSYDQTVVAADMRTPDAKAPRWQVASDVENLRWDIHDTNFFYVTTDNGIVYKYDIRNAPATPSESKPVWTLQAHDDSISSFDINPTVPGFLVTGSTDKSVKLWDTTNDKPNMVISRKLEVGKVFSTLFAPDPEVSFRLAVSGSKGVVQVWDTSTNATIRRVFAGRLPGVAPGTEGEVKERIMGVSQNDDSDSSDGEEEGGAEVAKDGWESMEEED